MLAAFNFINLSTLSTLLNCCGKTFTIAIHGRSGQNDQNFQRCNLVQNSQEKLSDVHRKVYLQSDAKQAFSVDVWHFLGRSCQRWKFWFFLAFLAKVTKSGNFGFS